MTANIQLPISTIGMCRILSYSSSLWRSWVHAISFTLEGGGSRLRWSVYNHLSLKKGKLHIHIHGGDNCIHYDKIRADPGFVCQGALSILNWQAKKREEVHTFRWIEQTSKKKMKKGSSLIAGGGGITIYKCIRTPRQIRSKPICWPPPLDPPILNEDNNESSAFNTINEEFHRKMG